MQLTRIETVRRLNDCLVQEMSAVETYSQTLNRFENPTITAPLKQAMTSHQNRVELLRNKVRQLNAEPVKSSGAWGAFTKLVELGAQVFGEKAVVSVLEEGEDKYLSDYKQLASFVGSDLKDLMQDLLIEQEDTHQLVSNLESQLP